MSARIQAHSNPMRRKVQYRVTVHTQWVFKTHTHKHTPTHTDLLFALVCPDNSKEIVVSQEWLESSVTIEIGAATRWVREVLQLKKLGGGGRGREGGYVCMCVQVCVCLYMWMHVCVCMLLDNVSTCDGH